MSVVASAALDCASALFEIEFGPLGGSRALHVHAPGRSEIAGNHTDHEGGHVIAGALDVSVDGIAAPNGTKTVRVASAGYPNFELSLDDLSPRSDEHVTTKALVRGMASGLAEKGCEPQGFDLALTCTVPAGGGLSSSAAVEAALGRAMEALWGGDDVDLVPPIALAKMSQRAENVFFGKPCGLMDQAAVCLGGLAFMDFENAREPRTRKLDLNFEDCGYALVLVDVGCDHAPFTSEYAAVPAEMQLVAAEFGQTRLCEVPQAAFDERLPELRRKLGDRCCLRAIHYFYENDLVDRRWKALQARDIDAFLSLTRESAASSAMYLQNVSCGGDFQPAMYALGLAERVLTGRGAVRIHGGGFGGSIQAFVPLGLVDEFIARMAGWLGEGSARRYAISEKGAYAAWL